MRHSLPRTRLDTLGEHNADTPADPERGPAARGSSSVTEMLVSRVADTRHGILEAVCLASIQLTPRWIRSFAVLWALIAGYASIAGALSARGEGSPPDKSIQTASTTRVQSGSPVTPVRFESRSTLRPRKHSHAFPKIGADTDPNDDEASDDPNDDVLWDDPENHDSREVPMTAGLQEMVPDLNPVEGTPAILADHPSSLLRTLQRLRC